MIMQENLKRKKFKKIRFRKIEIPNTINYLKVKEFLNITLIEFVKINII